MKNNRVAGEMRPVKFRTLMDMELTAINDDTNTYSSIIINRIFNGIVLIYNWLTRAVKNVLHGCGILMYEYIFIVLSLMINRMYIWIWYIKEAVL